jgi:hypothetical protein
MRLLLLALLATAATSSVAQAARVPDLSGMWNHPGIPGFRASGHGAHFAGQPQAARGRCRQQQAARRRLQESDSEAETAATGKKFGEIELGHYSYPTPRNQCCPGGVPFEFTNTGLMLVQKPEEILLLSIAAIIRFDMCA